MKTVLAGDIGGTKTLLQLVEIDVATAHYNVVHEQRYASQNYVDFDLIVKDFLSQIEQKITTTQSLPACFAVAGPIKNFNQDKQTASVTNLNWQLDSLELKTTHQLRKVSLINDFESIAHGLHILSEQDLVTLQTGQAQDKGVKLIMGAGTGLGVCQLVQHGSSYSVLASEGGHCDFAPADEQQTRLLLYLLKKYPHVSYDRILSGLGIENIFSFLANEQKKDNESFVTNTLAADDPAAQISNMVNEQPIAKETIAMFMSIYGAQAGNFALTALPYGGVYIGGGIAPKLIETLEGSNFLSAFKQKGRMNALMDAFPIHVIMDAQVGVKGAAVFSCRSDC